MKQEFFNPTLEGERFQDHTVPLELFKDFCALQEMLIEVAKWEFRKSHPDRERIPRNFTSGLDLHLEAVEEGSAILKISLVFASLFPTSNLSYFEQARTDIVDAVAAVEAGRAPSLPPRYLNYFDRFGRGLRSGESISFQNGDGKAMLTPETRQQLMRYAEKKEWTEEAVLRVRVPEADKGRNSFEMELNDGSKLSGTLSDLYRDAVLQAFHNYKTGTDEYVLVQGIVKKDRDGHLKGFQAIEHATPSTPRTSPCAWRSLHYSKTDGLMAKGWHQTKTLCRNWPNCLTHLLIATSRCHFTPDPGRRTSSRVESGKSVGDSRNRA